ncbi:MAG TPA: iron-sulfur cluster repair di-iron protein [Bryobacteraceae bacterium]|nr:iron-sulfur cluster repair di-iron protein [Bryobacteraceae bacterium]
MGALFERMVGEIAAEIPGSRQVFENHHIDYCCGGKRQLRDACRVAGVNADEIEAQILAASEIPAGAAPRLWRQESLKDLIRYIVEVHHAYLRSELPSLGRMITNLENFHGARRPEVLPLRRALARLTEELQVHLKKEEAVLFPAILRMEQAVNANEALPTSPFGSVRNPIWMMEQEHDAIVSVLSEIHTLTGDYTLRDQQCEMFRLLSQALQSLEIDLQEYIHLEDNILFPRAVLLEAQLNGGTPTTQADTMK